MNISFREIIWEQLQDPEFWKYYKELCHEMDISFEEEIAYLELEFGPIPKQESLERSN